MTQMVTGIEKDWADNGLPSNKPEEVAEIIAGVIVDRQRINGGALFCEGGRAWEFDKGIEETEKIWLGEKQSTELNRGQEVLGLGGDWGKR